jgi:hypothetical protein
MSDVFTRTADDWSRAALSMKWFGIPVADLDVADLHHMIGYLAREAERLSGEAEKHSRERLTDSLKNLKTPWKASPLWSVERSDALRAAAAAFEASDDPVANRRGEVLGKLLGEIASTGAAPPQFTPEQRQAIREAIGCCEDITYGGPAAPGAATVLLAMIGGAP